MDKSELPFLSASELSRLIASRQVSPWRPPKPTSTASTLWTSSSMRT